MRRVLLLVLLALALPALTWASSSIDFTNSGGTLSGSSSGLSLGVSTLIAVNGLNGGGLITGSNLGSVSLSTGALASGSLMTGGTFAAGGSFIISGNGTNGIPNGVIFNGTFSGPVTWSLVTLTNGTHNYTLQGAIASTSGAAVGATLQLTVNTGKGFFDGSVDISSGDTNLSVPEPGTLGLLGTGLLGIGGLMRRRLRIR